MEIELTYKLTCTNDKADELVAESLEAHFVTLIGLGMKDQISFRLTLPEDQIELKGLLLGKFLCQCVVYYQ